MTKNFPPNIFTSLDELLGMSRHARLFRFSAKKNKVNSVLQGRHTSRLRGRGLDFEEVRNYVKGDDIRYIDWKVTARTRETHTRVYTEEKERPVLIVVDQSSSMFFGSKVQMKSVVAAKLAAVAAFKVLKGGDRVGGVVFSENGTDYILPKRNQKNIMRFLECIVRRNRELADPPPADLPAVLKDVIPRVRNIVTHDYLVVIISDFKRYAPEVTRSISILSQHNDVVLVKVSDPLERELPQTDFIAGDHVSQISVKSSSSGLRNSYSAGYSEKEITYETEMRQRGIPFIQMNTVDPVEDQLKELFKQKI